MPTRTRSLNVVAILAIAFGLLTLVSGGRALFGGADMGAVVPFVLWFNFLAGFAYVAAGLGLWYQTGWATGLAIIIALATAAVFAAFLWRISTEAAFETRTMGAMVLRLAIWMMIAIVAKANGRVRQI
ncbi:hypothetical protein SAMN04488103_11181 [Gemmobacter aquatilis]|uniref:Uncharacterized protein n=1 Tax=Gemmobacter aquatilis TaxID=933059 RepID=A0A1H8LNQ8_9RHOB|nr:hypothetical protein [Gemmobacter aquatilis]SEO06757.1 hypothetical protein SAMN04488103_11181 [Gemmobacter aquatilis]